ncbi:hypothetical protein KC19_9G162400 [Ceratodon purpureus]|uniref:Uncharacterized protein n=1 Tax=Ceratodon purpureus TaxID=3225 RepID=A0A8T0GY22_CERPU|nr:hypothetical protein KC19_9G162400 [Ceratodon purpureus]
MIWILLTTLPCLVRWSTCKLSPSSFLWFQFHKLSS